MAEIIATFSDGRLLVQESKNLESRYMGSGIPFRIGHVKTVERVLSIDNSYAQYGLVTALAEVGIGGIEATVSGSPAERKDSLRIIIRQADIGVGKDPALASGKAGIMGASGATPMTGIMSSLASGVGWMGEILSGCIGTSGMVKITANVIAR